MCSHVSMWNLEDLSRATGKSVSFFFSPIIVPSLKFARNLVPSSCSLAPVRQHYYCSEKQDNAEIKRIVYP